LIPFDKDETLREELLKNYTLVEKRLIRCPHTETAFKMMQLIEKTKAEKDSIGGKAIKILLNNRNCIHCLFKCSTWIGRALL